MRFEARSSIDVSPEAVLAALCDREFWAAVGELPTAHAPEVVSIDEHLGEIRTRIRFRFRGELPRAVTRVVNPVRLTWVEETLWNVDALEGHSTIHPDHYPEKLHARGVTTLLAEPSGCTRIVRGELQVRVPLVGKQAERPIVQGLDKNLSALSVALGTWCR